jgi:hypothetical protein
LQSLLQLFAELLSLLPLLTSSPDLLLHVNLPGHGFLPPLLQLLLQLFVVLLQLLAIGLLGCRQAVGRQTILKTAYRSLACCHY